MRSREKQDILLLVFPSSFPVHIWAYRDDRDSQEDWYAFSQDIRECEKAVFPYIQNSRCSILTYDHKPAQAYKTEPDRWAAAGLTANPFSREQRIKYTQTVRTGETFAQVIYRNSSLYNALNSMIIHCPSFWEDRGSVNLRDYGYSGRQRTKYEEYIKKQLWMTGEVKRKTGISASNFYYFHPINFLRYVCSEFTDEFNPYLGEIFGKGTDYEVTVRDNPVVSTYSKPA